ncbi:MAG: hypothetical protein ACXV5H_07825 [Halobacteriota archaeon]
MEEYPREAKEIILYAKKALPVANFDNVEIEYIQESDATRSHFKITNVVDSAGTGLTLAAYYEEKGATLEDRVELWNLDFNMRLFAEML